MTTRIAINGMGRIGRATLRAVLDEPELELVAVNDIVSADNLAYLLRHDSAGQASAPDAHIDGGALVVGDRRIAMTAEPDPANLPWKDHDVRLVFECSGVFRTGEDLRKHLDAGAEQVVLSAPAKDDSIVSVVYGVNTADGTDADIVSTASCTTNCIAPVIEILDRRVGVRKATMTTVHAYTVSQELVDGPASKWRRGRAAAANIVPTTTGAATATAQSVPSMSGRFDGVALRVPVPVGSIADIVAVTERNVTAQELNDLFVEEAESDRYRHVVGISDDPLVSSDIIGDRHGTVIDPLMTTVTDGDLVKIMAWYDNETGYAAQMVRHTVVMNGQL